MQFVSQEAGKARQTNALMYNPTTDRYSIITNYNPEIQGAKGIDIDPSRVEQIKADIKASIERNIPWAVSNDYLSKVDKGIDYNAYIRSLYYENDPKDNEPKIKKAATKAGLN